MKHMKISSYFEVINPEYSFFKIIPVKSVRNYNTEQITLVCATLYKDLVKRIQKQEKKLWIKKQNKVMYYIYLEKDIIQFYFVLPYEYKNILIDKISNCWKNVTIEEISQKELPAFTQQAITFALKYKYKDFMSLNTNLTNNFLLASICNTLNVMKEGDKCGIMINITAQSTSSIQGWKASYQNMLQQFKEGYPIEKTHDEKFLLKTFVKIVYTVCDFIIECVSNTFGFQRDKKSEIMIEKELSNETKIKKYNLIVGTQILVASESSDKNTAKQNAISICQSFDTLNGDNEFEYCRVRTDLNMIDTKFKNVDVMKMSTKESGKLIELAGRELIEQYGIDCIDTQETKVPEILKQGYHCLGVNTCKGNKTSAYLPVEYNFAVMSTCLIGQQGSGKTVFISNLANSIQKQPESCIIIDYIKNCELSDEIIKQTPKDKLVVLDFADHNQLEAFSYNEIQPISNSVFDKLDCINRKSLCIETLLNALNADGEPLSVSMSMILNAACNVVFVQAKASLKDVIKCLSDYDYRHICIDKIPTDLKDSLLDEVETLYGLDSVDKKGVTSIFSSPYVKNTIVCYLFTKIWTATILRGSLHKQPSLCTLFIDEAFQCPTLMTLLSEQEILPQLRKFGLRCVLSCQHLEQMKKINDTLRSAGANYMYLKGVSKKDYEYMEEELKPFTYEDIESLPQFHSLNLINTKEGRIPFITKLPTPL